MFMQIDKVSHVVRLVRPRGISRIFLLSAALLIFFYLGSPEFISSSLHHLLAPHSNIPQEVEEGDGQQQDLSQREVVATRPPLAGPVRSASLPSSPGARGWPSGEAP